MNWRPYGVVDTSMVALLEELLASTGDDQPVRRAQLLGTLAVELCYSPRRAEGIAHARAAVRIATELGDVALLGRTLNNLYLAAWVPGMEAERSAALDQALALSGRGLPPHTEVVASLHRSALRLRFADLPTFCADLDRAHRLAADLGLPELRAQVSYQEAGLATLHGEWDLAEQRADEAFELQQRTSLWGATWCRIVQQMTIARGRGRLDEVIDDLVETTGADYPSLRPLALLSLAELGETGEARRLLQRWEMVVPQDWSTDFVLAAWGEVAAALGAPDPDRLFAELAPQAEELVVAGTANVTWGSVHAVLGRLAARRGDAAGAREHLEAAVRRNIELGAHPWAERARASLGRL